MIIKTQPKRAFSLIELLISLIVISCITAAFTPLITKKFSSGVFGSGGSGGESSGPVSTKCDDKFTAECLLCNDKACLSCSKICPDDLCQDVDNCVCKECPTTEFPNCAKFTSTDCLQCKNGYSLADGKCAVCPDGRYSDNGKECKYCEAGFWPSEDKDSCEPCPSGYICNDGIKIKCTGDTAPVIEENVLGNKTHVCAPCPEDSYCVDGVATKCSDKWKNCTKCSETECLACSDETILSDGKCVEGMDDILEIDGLYVTKFNMGDKASLKIPSNVKILIAGSNETCLTGPCCWQGTTSSMYKCGGNNGGYSGCTRTVCNWAAAKEICSQFDLNGESWRLPEKDEMVNWYRYSSDANATDIQLCRHDDTSLFGSGAACPSSINCQGSVNKSCYPGYIWTDNIYVSNKLRAYHYFYFYESYSWSSDYDYRGYAASVRCVANITNCPRGQYKNGSSCSNCSTKFSHCSACNSNRCTTCESGYQLHPYNNKCIKAIADAVPIDNLYVTSLNMGDGNLPLPSIVAIINTSNGDKCTSSKCCWKGTTANSEYCQDGVSTKDGGYTGCKRTVCNFNAAQEICAKYTMGGKTWRLPTKTELEKFVNYSITSASSELQLCDDKTGTSGSSGEFYSTICAYGDNCLGADANKCYPGKIWSSEVAGSNNKIYIYYLFSDVFSVDWESSTSVKTAANSVRCVTEIEY